MFDLINFQTPDHICKYMVSFLPLNTGINVLEPTPGAGNLVRAIRETGNNPVSPSDDFFKEDWTHRHFLWTVANPEFSPMTTGYKIMKECMDLSDNLILLMPWLTIINSERRTKMLFDYGLMSITHLPRNVFKGSRVQTCVIRLSKGYKGKAEFLDFVSMQ